MNSDQYDAALEYVNRQSKMVRDAKRRQQGDMAHIVEREAKLKDHLARMPAIRYTYVRELGGNHHKVEIYHGYSCVRGLIGPATMTKRDPRARRASANLKITSLQRRLLKQLMRQKQDMIIDGFGRLHMR